MKKLKLKDFKLKIDELNKDSLKEVKGGNTVIEDILGI